MYIWQKKSKNIIFYFTAAGILCRWLFLYQDIYGIIQDSEVQRYAGYNNRRR